MTKRKKEYADKQHGVMDTYYDLCEKYDGSNAKSIKIKLKQLIKKDPDFLDSYLLLHEILQDEGNLSEAEEILNEAYERALKLITDKEGNWPDVLEWLRLENRHIIRTILNKAISLWKNRKIDDAIDLLRKLLKTNPMDNIGARDYILAIRMNMSFEQFEKRFNKDGYYDSELIKWFDKNYKKFPDEFDLWRKAIEKYE